MKGNDQIIAVLNKLLAEELTAINQYMVHSELCANWGYERLHKLIEKTAIDEMKHAEKLIARILFLEGTPTVSRLNPMSIGKDVPSIIENDLAGEDDAIRGYNAAVALCLELKDSGTADLLMEIIEDEERHLDWHEAQRDQISQMGLANYLAVQTKE